MGFVNCVYISDPVPETFPNRLSILEIDELIPGIAKRVTQLMNSDQIDGFIIDRDEVLRELNRIGFYPKDLYIEKKGQSFMAFELFLTTVFMYLLGNKSPNDGLKKSDKWGNPYIGKKKNRVRNYSGFNF